MDWVYWVDGGKQEEQEGFLWKSRSRGRAPQPLMGGHALFLGRYDKHSSSGFLHLGVTDISYWLILLGRGTVLCMTDVMGRDIRITEISFMEG